MTKKVAVLAVNPVNGCGLFQYLEAFFENGIAYKVFAVADRKEIKTNSGIALTADDVVANLKGHEDEYDALVFACGDAVPVFQQNADKPYNVTMLEIIKIFDSFLWFHRTRLTSVVFHKSCWLSHKYPLLIYYSQFRRKLQSVPARL